MKTYGYAGFGFAMGSLAALVITLVLIVLRLLPTKMFYAGLVLLMFFLALLGLVFCMAQLVQRDYPFVTPTLILNLILIVVSIIFMLL